MAAGEKAPRVEKLEGDVEALGASASGSDVVRSPYAGTVTGATYVPAAGITGANTNSRTVSVINHGQDGAGTTSVASLAFVAGTNAAAFDEKALTLSVVAGATTVAEGDILEFKSLAVGTGIADPGGTYYVEIARS